jgi:Raf kinase inhibitor-like YbhB/YbcL family protein
MRFQLTSPAFRHDGEIPAKYTREGADVSPRLKWVGAPSGTKSFALIMDSPAADTDALVQWALCGIPRTATSLPRAIPNGPITPTGLFQGQNQFDRLGYTGPCPPKGESKKYYFRLSALDIELKPEDVRTGSTLAEAMKGHKLAEAVLMGTFQGTGARPENKPGAPRKLPLPTLTTPAPNAGKTKPDLSFAVAEHQAREQLKRAYSDDREVVTKFFQRHAGASGLSTSDATAFIQGVSDGKVRRALEDYLEFAYQSRGYFRLKVTTGPDGQNVPNFRFLPQQSFGSKFHVKYVPAQIVDGELDGEHLEPAAKNASRWPDDPYVEGFESKDLSLTPTMQEMIDKGLASYVRIDDVADYSVLKDLESFAYQPGGVTFIEHRAEQPYLMCIFGATVKKELLFKDLSKSLSEFQRKNFGGAHGGQKGNSVKQLATIEIDAKPISNDEKANELVERGISATFEAAKVRLSKLRQKMKEQKK